MPCLYIRFSGKRKEEESERLRQELENARQTSVWFQQQMMASQQASSQLGAKIAEAEKEKTQRENHLERVKMESAETKKAFNQALEVNGARLRSKFDYQFFFIACRVFGASP